MENPYVVLGIPKSASPDEVKKAYFGLIREHPPEKDPQGFKRIRIAYDSLRDAGKRSQTDLFLFNDPYGEFNIRQEGRQKYERDIHVKTLLYLISDLGRTDFSADFNEIPEDI